MFTTKFFVKVVALASAMIGLSAFAAPAEPVKVNLQAFKVVMANGKESLAEAKVAKPGDTIEYQAVYSNTSAKPVTNLLATIPVPKGMEYVPQTVKPLTAEASTDSKVFAPIPLVKSKVGAAVAELVPVAEYRALRWHLADLPAGRSVTVSARMKVSAQ